MFDWREGITLQCVLQGNRWMAEAMEAAGIAVFMPVVEIKIVEERPPHQFWVWGAQAEAVV